MEELLSYNNLMGENKFENYIADSYLASLRWFVGMLAGYFYGNTSRPESGREELFSRTK